MAGNSQRRGARRAAGSKKGPQVGSGGVRRRALEGKGPTPPAEMRPGHPAQRRAAAAARKAGRAAGPPARRSRERSGEAPELLLGRNPVVEALRAGVPGTALYVALGIEVDDRVAEALRRAGDRGVPILEMGRAELDRMASGAVHQGLGLQVPPFEYAYPDDLLARALESTRPPLIVALDGVTDPRNLGAVVRSAAAFGADGVLLPERRSASMTATAWRASAGTAAKLPVARVTNLTRTLRDYQQAGLFVIGLDADGEVTLDDLETAVDPLVIVVGSEGRGLSRLVGETCDLTVSIPMIGAAESLNASVAAAVTLAEVARRRRG
ncbi:MAG TPA: 23S rRNA (guanosine(2251)-2'-O)-methyltransferase RlmB [Mycobacteriales bacterium]|nr:23S rRNA (guanosine(2251)-2'-O)-methyltransferase RlmB [Mycobacteriales bacterium]